MHSATAIGAGRGEYYLSLGRDDYYLEGGEPPGQWYGKACEKLGLSGQVEKTEFRNLLAGRSADCREELVRKQHFIKTADGTQKEACAAYDLHFSVPKSVSVLWAMAPEDARKQIESCHDRAVKTALDVLQAEATFGRKGRGGTESLPAKMAVALFQHGASRALDPQLHHHAVVLNIAVCDDGKTRAIDGREFFRWQKTTGSIYDAELARLLHDELRLQLLKKGQSFEVKGVSESACNVFSKRRAEILEVADRSAHPAVREIVALETRERKAHVPHEKRLQMWRELGPEIGFGPREAEAVLGAPRILEDRQALKREAFKKALETLSAQESLFTTRQFFNALAQEAQARGLGPMVSEARQFLSTSDEVIRRGVVRGELRFATRDIWDTEARFIEAVEKSCTDTRHVVDPHAFVCGLDAFERNKIESTGRHFRLNDEQLAAVRELTLGTGSVKAITGMAGTGKTTMLGAATRIWQEAGLDVVGCALSGKAATGLREETGMDAESVAKTLSLIERGRLTLSERTVMVIDEAAMLDTFKAAKLADAVLSNGGKLVFVGDSDQLQAIGAGGAFQAVVSRTGEGHKKLTTITRQNREVDRKAVMEFSQGEAESALRSYAERGLVYVGAHQTQAAKRLVQDWEAHGGATEAKNHLIITGTRAVTEKLNAAAQERARLAGVLGDRNILVNGKTFFERDRVLFTYTAQGFDNGTLGTVERVDRAGNQITILLDSGKRAHVNLHRYDHLDLGYAITTHRGQGCTVQKNAYVLVGGRMQDLHLSYVQASRAKEDTRFYTTRLEAGDNLSRLAKAMSQSREKTFAHDFKDEPNRPEQGRSVSL